MESKNLDQKVGYIGKNSFKISEIESKGEAATRTDTKNKMEELKGQEVVEVVVATGDSRLAINEKERKPKASPIVKDDPIRLSTVHQVGNINPSNVAAKAAETAQASCNEGMISSRKIPSISSPVEDSVAGASSADMMTKKSIYEENNGCTTHDLSSVISKGNTMNYFNRRHSQQNSYVVPLEHTRHGSSKTYGRANSLRYGSKEEENYFHDQVGVGGTEVGSYNKNQFNHQSHRYYEENCQQIYDSHDQSHFVRRSSDHQQHQFPRGSSYQQQQQQPQQHGYYNHQQQPSIPPSSRGRYESSHYSTSQQQQRHTPVRQQQQPLFHPDNYTRNKNECYDYMGSSNQVVGNINHQRGEQNSSSSSCISSPPSVPSKNSAAMKMAGIQDKNHASSVFRKKDTSSATSTKLSAENEKKKESSYLKNEDTNSPSLILLSLKTPPMSFDERDGSASLKKETLSSNNNDSSTTELFLDNATTEKTKILKKKEKESSRSGSNKAATPSTTSNTTTPSNSSSPNNNMPIEMAPSFPLFNTSFDSIGDATSLVVPTTSPPSSTVQYGNAVGREEGGGVESGSDEFIRSPKKDNGVDVDVDDVGVEVVTAAVAPVIPGPAPSFTMTASFGCQSFGAASMSEFMIDEQPPPINNTAIAEMESKEDKNDESSAILPMSKTPPPPPPPPNMDSKEDLPHTPGSVINTSPYDHRILSRNDSYGIASTVNKSPSTSMILDNLSPNHSFGYNTNSSSGNQYHENKYSPSGRQQQQHQQQQRGGGSGYHYDPYEYYEGSNNNHNPRNNNVSSPSISPYQQQSSPQGSNKEHRISSSSSRHDNRYDVSSRSPHHHHHHSHRNQYSPSKSSSHHYTPSSQHIISASSESGSHNASPDRASPNKIVMKSPHHHHQHHHHRHPHSRQHQHSRHHHPHGHHSSTNNGEPYFYDVLKKFHKAFLQCTFLLPGLRITIMEYYQNEQKLKQLQQQQQLQKSSLQRRTTDVTSNIANIPNTPDRNNNDLTDTNISSPNNTNNQSPYNTMRATSTPTTSTSVTTTTTTTTTTIRPYGYDLTEDDIIIATRRITSAICAFGGTKLSKRQRMIMANQLAQNDPPESKVSVFRRMTAASNAPSPESYNQPSTQSRLQYEKYLSQRYYENENHLSWENEDNPPVEVITSTSIIHNSSSMHHSNSNSRPPSSASSYMSNVNNSSIKQEQKGVYDDGIYSGSKRKLGEGYESNNNDASETSNYPSPVNVPSSSARNLSSDNNSTVDLSSIEGGGIKSEDGSNSMTRIKDTSSPSPSLQSQQNQDSSSSNNNNSSSSSTSGNNNSNQPKMKYRCKLCGLPKQNHVCPYQQSLQRSIGTMIYPAVNAFVADEPGLLAPPLSEMNNFINANGNEDGIPDNSSIDNGNATTGNNNSSTVNHTSPNRDLNNIRTFPPNNVTPETSIRSNANTSGTGNSDHHNPLSPGSSISFSPHGTPYRKTERHITPSSALRRTNKLSHPNSRSTPSSSSRRSKLLPSRYRKDSFLLNSRRRMLFSTGAMKRRHQQKRFFSMVDDYEDDVEDAAVLDDSLFVDELMEIRNEQYRVVTPPRPMKQQSHPSLQTPTTTSSTTITTSSTTYQSSFTSSSNDKNNTIDNGDAYTFPPLPLPYLQRKRLSDSLFALSKEVPRLTDECAIVLREARERDMWDQAVAELMTQVIVVIHCHPDDDRRLVGLRHYLLALGIAC